MQYNINGLNTGQSSRLEKGEILPVMEDFYTIQGEGANTGKAAYFVRIGGCDVGCHWCDVKESWDASIHPLVEVKEILEKIRISGADSVVITGGEPLQYNLGYITSELKKNNIRTFIETSGSYPLTGYWDWICLSPKKTLPPLEEIYRSASELKIIVYNSSDFAWAEEQAEKCGESCCLFLQPEWSRLENMLPKIVDYVKLHNKWRISLQTHKYMNIP